MGDFLPWIHHDRMHSVHELIETKFMKEMISLLSVSFEDGGFFPLEWFFVYSNWVRVLRESWWGSWRWCWRRWSSEPFLRGFRVQRCRSEPTLCREGPCEFVTYRRCHFRWSCRWRWSSDGSDLTSRLIIGLLQVIMDVSDSF